MLNEQIKLIIFDCYDTILSIESNKAYKNLFVALKEMFSLNREDINYLYDLVLNKKNINWERVILSLTNQTIFNSQKEQLNLALKKLNDDLIVDNESIHAYSDINVLALLKNEYKMALYSNLAQGYEIKINSILHSYFDKIYLSFETGVQKPNAQAFELVKDEFKAISLPFLEYSNIALIDDKIANINSAQELGMQGILIDRQLSHLNAINTLKQLLY